MNWSERPFIRILFLFILGILIAKFIPGINRINSNVFVLIVVILLAAVIITTVSHLKHKYLHVIGLLFALLITITGILISIQNTVGYRSIYANMPKRIYLANIISNPTQTKQSVKAILRVIPTTSDSITNTNIKKVLCYFSKDSLSTRLKYGDIIAFSSKLTVPAAPQNPAEFNFGNYLIRSGITYTSYITSGNWKLIDYSPSNRIIAYAGNVRDKILKMLRKNGLSGNNYAVAATILLGYDDYLENDLKQDYIMAGAIHILCISGLHVGIIYLVINFLLSFLINNRLNNILKAIILLISVWAYAIITGLAPSVQRASLMITVFILGDIFKRNHDSYNTLAISALILLLINPNLIFSVGFQLSYAAVLGIITFYKPIYNLIYFKNIIADSIWSITVLSFTAQMATFPIATHYFHFFPTWFWLTNLFTFPLSFLIISTGLAFVLTSWLPLLPHLIGIALSWMVFALNYVVGFVKFLPFSGIDYIYTSLPMMALLYMLMLLAYFMFTKRNILFLKPVLIVTVLIIGLSSYHKYNNLKQKKVIIYSINKHSTYDFIDGSQHILLTDSTLTSDAINYHLKNSRALWGIDDVVHTIPTKDTVLNGKLTAIDNFLIFNNIIILVADGKENYYPSKTKMPLDLLIISGKKRTNINRLLSVFNIRKVVIDSSVPYWKQRKVSSQFKKEGVDCYNVNTDGALVVNL